MPETPDFNPTPKAKFQRFPAHTKLHLDLIASPQFDISSDVALLQMQRILAASDFPPDAAFHRIAGATQFLDIFRRLAEPPKKAPVRRDDNLPSEQ